MQQIALKPGDVDHELPLPWRVFDHEGRLVLAAGHRFKSAEQLETLLARGLFREPTDEELNAASSPERPALIDPFAAMAACTASLGTGLHAMLAGDGPPAETWVLPLVDQLIELGHMHTDAMLGALLLVDALPYSLAHPWMCATLCNLIGRRIDLPEATHRSLIAAALTANVGMVDVQDQLSEQASPLTDEQRRHVNQHPVRSAKLLMGAGVGDQRWLQFALTHHERIDGSGYPRKLSAEAIPVGTRVLGLADTYSAMLLPRAYRDGLHAKKALLEIFTQRGSCIDAELAAVFIREIGIYPPGVLVKLENGETAVVIRRNPLHRDKPIVASLRNPLGKAFDRPLVRDTASVKAYAVKQVLGRAELPFPLLAIWGR